MSKTIQVSTVEKMANIEVIELNSYFISKAVKAQYTLEQLLAKAKREKETYNEETKKYEKILDEKGKPVIEYNSISGAQLAEKVLPFLNELVKAFEEE